jgi:glucose uptake protein GlcU
MKDIDEKIREVLQQQDSELLEHYRNEQSIPQMVIDSFRSRHRWLVVLVFTISTVFFLLEFVVAYQFFQAESTRAMIAWATAFVVCVIIMYMMKIWYWMELNKNSLAREIKRLELELANLSRRLSSPSSQR